jgi:hypothetical protein
MERLSLLALIVVVAVRVVGRPQLAGFKRMSPSTSRHSQSSSPSKPPPPTRVHLVTRQQHELQCSYAETKADADSNTKQVPTAWPPLFYPHGHWPQEQPGHKAESSCFRGSGGVWLPCWRMHCLKAVSSAWHRSSLYPFLARHVWMSHASTWHGPGGFTSLVSGPAKGGLVGWSRSPWTSLCTVLWGRCSTSH